MPYDIIHVLLDTGAAQSYFAMRSLLLSCTGATCVLCAAFLVLARVMAAEHQSTGQTDELHLLSQILGQVPGLRR